MKKLQLLLLLQLIVSIVYSREKHDLSGFKTDNNVIYDICFTRHGEALGIADNNEIKVYNTKTRDLLNAFKNGHRLQILAIDISKDSSLLVSGGKDSTIVIWDFIRNTVLKSLKYQKGIITSLKISPDGQYLVSGGTDNKIYLYDLIRNEIIMVFNDHTDDVTSIAISPDGKIMAAAGGDNLITFYDIENLKLITSLKEHKSWVRDISFNYDGTNLISCGDDSRVITWSTSDKNNIRKQADLKSGRSWLLCLANDPESKSYAFCDINGKINVYSQFGRYKTRIKVPVNHILFKPDEGTYFKIVAATRGRGVLLIEGENMKLK
jgi:WD40 repeat protein